ncbi:MAG: hypothetical protein WBP93_10705 [Pyrinomonadaceae bacterium]
MEVPVTISPEEPVNKGLDYASLKQEGVVLVQELAGKIWTDYNEHDPGVTTLEQLCYALTELSYRAEFPLGDLLIDKESGRINPRQQALFIPRRIFPCNPLTANDYRKLIVDRVPQVANAWLTPHSFTTSSKAVNGLYDIALYAPGADPCVCDDEHKPELIRNRVRRVYTRHRNLCEDVHSIFLLKPARTIVNARVSINDALSPEAILASIFFNLANFLAPELRRQSLKSMLDTGRTPDEIFNGPLLRNGFITENQLQPKQSEISVQEIIRTIAGSKGVTSVSGVTVKVGAGGKPYSGEEEIPVSWKNILQLQTGADSQSGGFTIHLFKNGIEYKPNPALVARELNRLWADYRRTYKLSEQYDEFFAIPTGQYKNVEQYYSIQNQYPNVYGINSFGLPTDAPVVRQAQANQLKGYLLVFDQLMADFFAQLAHVKDLYSIEYDQQQTYFYQYLNETVPNVAPLLKDDYQPGLSRIVRGQDRRALRRNRFLDFLLALYAETLDAFSLTASDQGEDGASSVNSSIRAKLALLRHLVASTHNRGRGFDYLAPPSAHNICGMEIKSRIQLGMSASYHRPLIDALDELALNIVESDQDATIGRTLDRYAEQIEENFVSVTSLPEKRDEQPSQLNTMLRGQSVTDAFLRAAREIENFRVGSLPGDTSVALVCKSPSEENWHLVGKYAEAETAAACARSLAGTAQNLSQTRQQLYIVEHTLLRFGRSKPDEREQDDSNGRPDQSDFVYSFTITAVVSRPSGTPSDADYQTIVREVIRQNTPAHVVADYCFLRPQMMRRFESLYWAWRRALRNRQRREIIITSARLRSFLQRCQREP